MLVLDKIERIERAHTKCWVCIKDKSNCAAKDVVYFNELGMGICEQHLKEIVKEHLGLKDIIIIKE
ncbi:MAG: hypothetical protein IKN54_04380 [Lachnospiraceae bacterium]|nr:hypothetical protein [Lachnospiraceae bacterium]